MKIVTAISSQISQIRSFNRSARLFLLATVMDGIVFSGWNLFFNFYILERGFGRDFLGMVNAVPSLAALLLGLWMGQLSDRMGRKRAMVLGVALSVFCMGLQVTVTQPWLILVVAFLAGAANSLYYLSHAPFMMKVSTGDNRTLLFSLNFGFVTLSGAVGSVFAGQLPAFFGGLLEVPARSATAYQAVLLASVFLSMFTLIPLLLIREPRAERAGGQRRAAQSVWQVLKKPLTLKLALPNLLIGFGAAILVPYFNVFFSERFNLGDQALGALFSVSAILTGIGSLIGPRLAGNLGSKIKAVVLTQAGSLLFLLLMGFSPFLGLVMVAFLARGALMNLAVPLYDAFAMEQIHEREQGTVNSVKSLAWQVGWAVGPYLSGLVQQAYGFGPLFAATAVMYASAIGVTWIFFHNRESMAEASSPDPSFMGLPSESLHPAELPDTVGD